METENKVEMNWKTSGTKLSNELHEYNFQLNIQNKIFNYLLKNTLLRREGKLSELHLVGYLHPFYLQETYYSLILIHYGRQRVHENKTKIC